MDCECHREFLILVTGDRNWDDYPTMLGTLKGIDDEARENGKAVRLIHGMAKGADKMAQDIALSLDWTVTAVPAEWEKYGKKAGPIRNSEMLKLKPVRVIGFHKSIWTSKGTLDCLQKASKLGIKVELHQ